MDCRLQAFKRDPIEGKIGTNVCFVVVDSNKTKSYPSNFVCVLPLKMQKGKIVNIFGEVFGDKSLDVAMGLLKEALKTEEDSEVKTEIERRLKLIDPKQVNQIKCCACGKQFQAYRVKRFRQNFCPECLNKKYHTKQW